MATAYTCKLLHCFHKIAMHRSFSKAAVELGVAQPNLSLMMTRLEDIVGEKLFDQRRPPMRISSVGARIIDETRKLCDEMEKAHLLVSSIRSTIRSTVRIGGSSATADIILRKIIIKTFAARYPDIDVAHIDVPTGMELAYLAERKVDLLFSYCPPAGFPNAVIQADNWGVS